MIGSSFAGYKVLERLGGGNTGVVYKAFDVNNQVAVALKILPNDLLATEEKKARFLRESQASVMLDHESIAKLYEVGEYHGCSYFVMEYVDGKSFRQLLDEQPNGFDMDYFFANCLPILEAVAFAHRLGIIHRDLKPENIKLTQDGKPKVLDFGLVKFLGDESKDEEGFKTLTGMVLGSARYMSPEQANGEPLDMRTDVFSLGIIMYEMLTGKNPFHTKSPFLTMQRILNDDPISIELLRPEVPIEVADVVDRCLEKDSADRFENADAVYHAMLAIRE